MLVTSTSPKNVVTRPRYHYPTNDSYSNSETNVLSLTNSINRTGVRPGAPDGQVFNISSVFQLEKYHSPPSWTIVNCIVNFGRYYV